MTASDSTTQARKHHAANVARWKAERSCSIAQHFDGTAKRRGDAAAQAAAARVR